MTEKGLCKEAFVVEQISTEVSTEVPNVVVTMVGEEFLAAEAVSAEVLDVVDTLTGD